MAEEKKEKKDYRKRSNDKGRGFNRDRRSGDRKDFRRGGNRDRRNIRNKKDFKEKFKVICAECGEQCEVPFKPTAGKPVLCDRCFNKQNLKKAILKDKDYQKEFDTINAKLDLLLKEIIELKQSKSKSKK